MVAINLRHVTENDLAFIHEVRHDPSTLRFLHDQRVFSLEEMLVWFRESSPDWYIVEADGIPVGYVRTSNDDRRCWSIKIGADIHPHFRRRGFALLAYQKLFDQLTTAGYHRVWLEVLPTNVAARNLYDRLGFSQEGLLINSVRCGNAWLDSIIMGRLLTPSTGLNVKAISVYLGNRRFRPKDSREAYDMLRFLIDKELALDPGCDCDTLLVYSRTPCESDQESLPWIAHAEELMSSLNGTPTRRGRFRVQTRENFGLSFGAFNDAFAHHMREYDYWFFCEDDQIVVADGCFADAITQMEADTSVGFVAVVGVSPELHHPPHAHGGVGVTSRTILRQVKVANPCDRHPEGHLPYHADIGYDLQEFNGEIRFTNAISQLGYRLIDLNRKEVCISWGHQVARNSRMLPWCDWMARHD